MLWYYSLKDGILIMESALMTPPVLVPPSPYLLCCVKLLYGTVLYRIPLTSVSTPLMTLKNLPSVALSRLYRFWSQIG